MSMNDILGLQAIELDYHASLEVKEGTSSDSGTCSCKSVAFCFD